MLIVVRWLEKRSKAFEPTYLYTIEKVICFTYSLFFNDHALTSKKTVFFYKLAIIAPLNDFKDISKSVVGVI